MSEFKSGQSPPQISPVLVFMFCFIIVLEKKIFIIIFVISLLSILKSKVLKLK